MVICCGREAGAVNYSEEVELKMRRYSDRLSEKDRRGYAAIEAAKLGHGGIEYISRLLDIDQKTVQRGLRELESSEDPAPGRVRKKGAAGKKPFSKLKGPNWSGNS